MKGIPPGGKRVIAVTACSWAGLSWICLLYRLSVPSTRFPMGSPDGLWEVGNAIQLDPSLHVIAWCILRKTRRLSWKTTSYVWPLIPLNVLLKWVMIVCSLISCTKPWNQGPSSPDVLTSILSPVMTLGLFSASPGTKSLWIYAYTGH